MSSVCLANERRRRRRRRREREIISIALLACRCHRALMIEMLERWVHLHLPNRQSRKKKKDLSSTIFLLRAHLFIIQSCPLLINNMPIVVSSTHLASALTPVTNAHQFSSFFSRRRRRRRRKSIVSPFSFSSLSFAVG